MGKTWSSRARRALLHVLGHQADLTRPEVVAQASEMDLRATLGCGETTIREIQSWLAEHGLKLAANVPRSPRQRSRFRLDAGANRTRRNPVDIELGLRIRRRRRELHLTREQLAAQVRTSAGQMQKYENGRVGVSAAKLLEIARALKVTIAFFLEEPLMRDDEG
jgi:DNA-binding XRE family transcriptional regulator